MTTKHMTATGEWLTAMIRSMHGHHLGVLKTLEGTVSEMKVREVVALLECRARLEGDTGTGVRYVEEV